MADEQDTQSLRWDGAFDDAGLPTGKGMMTYPPPPVGEDEEPKPGDRFEGELAAGRRQGRGRYTWSSGSYYDGQYADNLRHGEGTQLFPNGDRYEGSWVQGRLEGEGMLTYACGDIYQGQFLAGAKHGEGSYFHKASGSQYIGRWEAGAFAEGRWVLRDGTRYEGNFAGSTSGDAMQLTTAAGLRQRGALVVPPGEPWTRGTWRACSPLLAAA